MPPCALITPPPLKKKLPVDLQLQSSCVSLAQVAEPGFGVLQNHTVKSCGPQTARSEHCIMVGIDKQKKKKRKNTKHGLICHSWVEPAPLQVVPFLLLQLRAHFWHQNKSEDARGKRGKTEQNNRCTDLSDGVCLCAFVWVRVDVRGAQLEACALRAPQIKLPSATDASLPCCDGRKKLVSIATQESAYGGAGRGCAVAM